MDGWNKISSSLSGFNFGQSAGRFAKGFNSSVQATREKLGQVAAEDITDLPQEYKDLEARVDALRAAHMEFLKITRVYQDSSYDYPTQIQESLTEMSTTLTHTVTSFAATNFKGTALPTPPVTPAVVRQYKTLPHALERAASSASAALGNPETSRLGTALKDYADAWGKIAAARLDQDDAIVVKYLAPWQATLSNSIAIALKARQAVRVSRLELDAAKQTLKASSNVTRQEQVTLEVEHAEDDLVQKTEVAISMMKAVLENPEPLKNLNELAKAQLVFHSVAAESLAVAQGEIEELSVAAEAEYRKSRDA